MSLIQGILAQPVITGLSNSYSVKPERSLDRYVRVNDNTILDNTATALAIEGHFRIDSAPATNTNYSLFSLVTSPSGSNGYLGFVRYRDVGGTKSLLWAYKGSGGAGAKSYETTLTVGAWYHIALIVDGLDDCKLYIDKVNVSSEDWSGSSAQNYGGDSNGLTIGGTRESTPVYIANCTVNNFRVFNTVRTAQQIADNWEEVLTSGTGLRLSLFNQEANSDDQTTNGYDGTDANSITHPTETAF